MGRAHPSLQLTLFLIMGCESFEEFLVRGSRSVIVFFIAVFYLFLNISPALAELPILPIGDFQARSSVRGSSLQDASDRTASA